MLFIWGSGGGSVVAGDAGIHDCPVCESRQRFDVMLNYRYRHFWYLLSWVTKREYAVICSRCHNGVVRPKEQVRSKLADKDPIPFLRRKGWLVCAVIIALLVAWTAFESDEDKKQLEAQVTAPQVGDVYLADLAQISKSFNAQRAYGAMKLIAIDPGHERFVTAREGYNRQEGVKKDIASGQIHLDSYYDANDPIDLTPDQVLELKHQGVIYRVVR